MTGSKTKDSQFGRWAGLVGAAALVMGVAGEAEGQSTPDPGQGGKKPYVTIVLDTSASMEWTSRGDSSYPQRDYEVLGFSVDPYADQPDDYPDARDPSSPSKTQYPLGVGAGGDDWDEGLGTDFRSSGNPIAVGPCYVWEPVCTSYERPSWNPATTWTDAYGDSLKMGGRLSLMRGTQTAYNTVAAESSRSTDKADFPLRLLNTSQPRHVSFKEVLTGEMVMRPRDVSKPIQDVNHLRYGPGCWFVPRQWGQDEVNACTTNSTDYTSYPDHRDPRPHLQEVYDGQKTNGLLDALKYEMFFTVASFDSYQWPQTGGTFGTTAANDDLPTVDWDPTNLEDTTTGSFQGFNEDNNDEYNLGIYRVAGPSRLDVPKRFMPNLSKYAQYALADSGTLKRAADPNLSTSADFTLDPDNPPSEVGFAQESDLDKYLMYDKSGTQVREPYTLSRQPVARFTPLAPAVYDLQQWFNKPNHPVNTDKFKQCRPKHVILMSDGQPLPESDAGNGCTGSAKGLSGNFKINSNKYNYECAESHIEKFVTGTDGGQYMVGSSGPDPKYDPRVHVVGLNVQGDGRSESIAKLASMAEAGKTCAGYFLKGASGSSDWIPQSGQCPRDDHPCLVEQPNSFPFVSFQDPDQTATCEYPALILQCNGDGKALSSMTDAERAAYKQCRSADYFSTAIQQIFNQILGSSSLSSRTKPAISNRLDDPDAAVNGQYRFYSGVKVDGTNPYWRGVMFREKRVCAADGTGVTTASGSFSDPCSNDYFECFHKQIADQVTNRNVDGLAQEDNRRVFTSIPQTDSWDYSNSISKSHDDADCGYFHSTYHMEPSGTLGEFQNSYLEETSTGSPDALLNDRRVPLEYNPLKEALVGNGTDLTKPLAGLVGTTLTSYFRTSGVSDLKQLIDQVRGRIEKRADRVLGGILNSNPVAVEPPSRNVPIESYRDFKARFADRPTMVYFSTVDGMLHALHSGDMDGGNQKIMVRDGMDPSSAGDNVADYESAGAAEDQREAWAYVPNMILDHLADYRGTNPYLIDGSPVVADVRLCHEKRRYNQNFQACRSLCDSSDQLSSVDVCSGTKSSGTCVPPEMQWRSVLVQGLGQAGSGYFAMDVTRPGGPYPDGSGGKTIQPPDPIPLWEFNPNWERGQIRHMVSSSFPKNGEALVYPPDNWRDNNTGSLADNCSADEDDANYFWKQPFMGESVGDPAIGTVVMPGLGDDPNIRRPVAVFTAGAAGTYGTKCDRTKRSGRAIYVVDLQTGSLIRRFVGYQSSSGWKPFDASVLGTPALHDNSTGSLVTRGFVGDAEGRMFRIDFSKPNPADWEVTLFFNPKNTRQSTSILSSGETKLGPAAMQPAVALGSDDNMVVVYGLGSRGDSTNKGEEQMVIAVKEDTKVIANDAQGKLLWYLNQSNGFNDDEKLTGEPVIFNRGVYFTSYYLKSGDVCSTGRTRIWGMTFDTDTSSATLPAGVFDCANNGVDPSLCNARYFEPKEDVLIRGLTITLGPTCSVSGSSRSSAKMMEQDDRQPQLIAATGSADPGSGIKGSSPTNSSASDFINRLEVGIDSPRSQTIPMSWTVISQ